MRQLWIAGLITAPLFWLALPSAASSQAYGSARISDYAANSNGSTYSCDQLAGPAPKTAAARCPASPTLVGTSSAAGAADLPSRTVTAMSTISVTNSDIGICDDTYGDACLEDANASGMARGTITVGGVRGNPTSLVFTYFINQSNTLSGVNPYTGNPHNYSGTYLYASLGEAQNGQWNNGYSEWTTDNTGAIHTFSGQETGTGPSYIDVFSFPFSPYSGHIDYYIYAGVNTYFYNQPSGAYGAGNLTATLTSVSAVNDAGQTVGDVQFDDQGNGVLMSPTSAPEPSSVVFLGTGLVGVGMAGRQRKFRS